MLPNRAHTDVRDEVNWLYPLDAPTSTNVLPTIDAHDDIAPEGGDPDEEMDQREPLSPTHSYLHLTSSPERHHSPPPQTHHV